MTLPILEALNDLEALVCVCEDEFGSPGTEAGSGLGDDSPVAFPSSRITFGHIRRARTALSNLTEAVAEALPGSEPGALSTTDGGAPHHSRP